MTVAWLYNLTNIKVELPTSLIDDHILRKANEDEVENVKEFLQSYSGRFDLSRQYEYEKVSGPTQNSFSFVSLERCKWKYYVVENRSTAGGAVNDGFLRLQDASLLMDLELELPMYFQNGKTLSYLGNPYEMFGREIMPFMRKEITIDESSIAELCEIDALLVKIKSEYEDIRRTMAMFARVSRMNEYDELAVLGHFAVIESMLTHDPRGDYDSLGHQIKTKVALLQKRLKRKIDYSSFQDAADDNVWTKLYELRSRVAHGGTIKFTGKLQCLKGLPDCVKFLREAAKSILRHTLEDPELLLDLKRC